MHLDEIIRQVSKEFEMPYEVCRRVYMSAWKFISEKAQEHKLSTETPLEEFNSYRMNFNVRGLGKFHITPEDFVRKNKRFLTIQKLIKEKHDKDNKDD